MRGVPGSANFRHSSTMPLSKLVLRATGSLPLGIHGSFATAHQEDRDAFHQGRAGTKVRGACTSGADADADALPVIHSRLRARREAAIVGHSSGIRE